MATNTTRPTAAEATAVERRRRVPGTLDHMQNRKLGVSPEILAANAGYVLRWTNDVGNRVYARTVQDDWEKVDGVEPRPVDTNDQGKPIYAHLLRKKDEFWNEDQKAKLDVLNEREKSSARASGGDSNDKQHDGKFYAPAGNTITHSGYKP